MNRNRLPGYNALTGRQRLLLQRMQLGGDDSEAAALYAAASEGDRKAIARYFISGQARTDDNTDEGAEGTC